MTQEEIIDMAIQAGASPDENRIWLMYAEEIEAFAKLVAAKAFQNGYEKGIAAFNESGYMHGMGKQTEAAITTIKETLAQQPAPVQQEAIARRAAKDITKGYDMKTRIEMAIKEALAQEQFCDANCVWTDHHPDCRLTQTQDPSKANGHFEQPNWSHVGQAFIDGAREARANPDADEELFVRAADGYTKKLFEELDPESERLLREDAYQPLVQQEPVGKLLIGHDSDGRYVSLTAHSLTDNFPLGEYSLYAELPPPQRKPLTPNQDTRERLEKAKAILLDWKMMPKDIPYLTNGVFESDCESVIDLLSEILEKNT